MDCVIFLISVVAIKTIWRWAMGQVEALNAQMLNDYAFYQMSYNPKPYFYISST